MLPFLLLACQSPVPWTRAAKIQALDEIVGGPKSSAVVGDYLLENDRLRAGVLGPRYSMGPSPFGGTLADLDLRRTDPSYGGGHGNDQLAELFSTVNMNLVGASAEGDVTIVSDGADGDAIARVEAPGEPFLSLLGALWAIVDQPEFTIRTDYVLAAGSPAIRIETTAYQGESPAEAEAAAGSTTSLDVLGLAMTSGLAFGDFYLQGGSIDVFAPGLGFDEDRAVYDRVEAGQNTFELPLQMPFVAGVGDGVSYALAPESGDLFVPLFTGSQTAAFGAGAAGQQTAGADTETADDDAYDRFPAGRASRYVRYLGVGRGDVGSALDALLEARGDAVGTVFGRVVESGTGVALSGVSVLVFRAGEDAPYSQWETDVGDDTLADGSFGGMLPPGDYELLVHQRGRPAAGRVSLSVVEGETVEALLAAPRPGQVDLSVVDELGRAAPSKVTLFRADGEEVLVPNYGDPYVPGEPAEVVYLPYGGAIVSLPPGRYHAVASRGIEYELGESAEFTVSADRANRVQLQVIHSVDSAGWISADFHVHAVNSFDSGVQLSDRVATMVGEGIDFFTSSDHDFLTDYAPTVEDMGLEYWVKTAVGLETTTLEVGHFLGFPLQSDAQEPSGGAPDWTDKSPDQIVADLKGLGIAVGYDPIAFVAHPRDGILGYFDQFRWDPITGQLDTSLTSVALRLVHPVLAEEENFSLDFEGIELLNGKRFELIRTPTQPELDEHAASGTLTSYRLAERTATEQEQLIDEAYALGYGHQGQVDDWFTLLNTGARLTALANSDTHGMFEIEAGCPRNFVYVGDDDPVALDEQAVADAVRAGHVVASYGPFIQFSANDGAAIVGDEIADGDGTVDLHVEVQAPTWMSVDRVELYQDGTLIQEWSGLDPDVYRFIEDVAVPVAKDSWFVVVALGNDDLAPVFTPVEIPPVQLQDVVTEALSGVPGAESFASPAIPIPRSGPTLPYAVTNPIYVDADGGGWSPPGIPEWVTRAAPVEPE